MKSWHPLPASLAHTFYLFLGPGGGAEGVLFGSYEQFQLCFFFRIFFSTIRSRTPSLRRRYEEVSSKNSWNSSTIWTRRQVWLKSETSEQNYGEIK